MLTFLDIFFTVFHTCLIVFNLFGWLWKYIRKINLITLLLTGSSWFILGLFYGIGYCPLTEWHWEILKKLGYNDLPDSYISFLSARLTGINVDQKLAVTMTLIFYFLALGCSVFVNFFHRRGNRENFPDSMN
jgi:hypothetical protein